MPWVPVDYRVFLLDGIMPSGVSGGGTLDLMLPPVGGGQLWRVERVSVELKNPLDASWQPFYAPIVVSVYDRLPGTTPGFPAADRTVLPFLNAPMGIADVYDVLADDAAITILEGQQCTVRFFDLSDAMVGSICSARLQVTIMQGVAGAPQPVAGATPAPTIPEAL